MTMNITNAQFTANGSITALVDGVQLSIPADAGNRHYAAMLGQGIEITLYAPPVPTPAETRAATLAAINAERDRRLAADFEFAGKLYQRDSVSVQRITGAATLAGFAMGEGAQAGNLRWHGGSNDFAWIASDNSLTFMDAPTAFAFGNACATIETRLIFAAKALRDTDPIPTDFTNDSYWL